MNDTTPTSSNSIAPSAAADALLATDSLARLVQIAEARLREHIPEAKLALWWTLRAAPKSADALHCAPRSARAWAEPAPAMRALTTRSQVQAASGAAGDFLRSLPLEPRDAGQAVLQLGMDEEGLEQLDRDPALQQMLEQHALRIVDLLEMRHLRDAVRRLERSEAVQRALYRIAELTSASASMEEFYASVHAQVGELLYARNFYFALLVDDGAAFDYPYAVDEHDDAKEIFRRTPLRHGLTEYVQRTGRPLLLDPSLRERLIAAGEIRQVGAPSVAWLGVPLVMDGAVAGVLAVQSYSEAIHYGPRDQELLAFVAQNIATALQRKQAADSLRAAYAQLQVQIEELRRTQAELIETEKMASLGRLVAGVAHEINTPLGIAVTSASHLDGIFKSIERAPQAAQSPELGKAVGQGQRCVALILNNLGKAAQLVRSFKQVAVDQTSEVRRPVEMCAFLDDVLVSLHPRLKATPHRVEVDCPRELVFETLPGALYQIVSNILLNALLHAFDEGQEGQIRICCAQSQDAAELTIGDDGRGMSEVVLARVFEPFFTTKRGQGGTGLGLHLVYNLVTQLLAGTITCTSAPGQGTCFTIRLPLAGSAAAAHPEAPPAAADGRKIPESRA